jgi:hypothetical protein
MGYSQLLRSQHGAGTLLNTYTTAKSVINSQAICPIPPGLLQLGDMLRIRAAGGLSNVITTQCQFTFQVMMGAAQPSSIIAHASQALLTTNVAHTLIPFEYEVWMRLDSEGSGTSAKFLSQAKATGIMFPISGNVGDPTATVGTIMCPATAPAVGTGWDSTVLNYLDFFVGIQTSNAGNGIQIYQYTVELLSERN